MGVGVGPSGRRRVRSPGRRRGAPGTVRPVALTGLLAVLVAGCAPEELPAQPDGVVGTVWSVSDVSGIPDARATDGGVLALPDDALDDVLALAGPGSLERDLGYAGFTAPAEAIRELGGTTAELDSHGRFRLAVTGDVLLCRTGRAVADGQVRVRGCARTAVAGGDVVRVTTGEGGLAVGPAR